MFNVGDYAVATMDIRRVDGKSNVKAGERVKITSVHNLNEYTIVDIEPCSGGLRLIDICCDNIGPLKPCK